MPNHPVTRAVCGYWPITEDSPSADGSILFLRVPPEVAHEVRTVRLPSGGPHS